VDTVKKTVSIGQALLDLRNQIHDICEKFEQKHGKAIEDSALVVTGEIYNDRVVLRLSMETPAS